MLNCMNCGKRLVFIPDPSSSTSDLYGCDNCDSIFEDTYDSMDGSGWKIGRSEDYRSYSEYKKMSGKGGLEDPGGDGKDVYESATNEDVDYTRWYGVGVGVWTSVADFALEMPAIEVPPGSKWLDMGEFQLDAALEYLEIHMHKGQLIFYKVVPEGAIRSTEEEVRAYLKYRGA